MDTQALIRNLFDANGWPYRIDPLDGDVTAGFAMDVDDAVEPVTLLLKPMATRIEIVAPFLLKDRAGRGDFDPVMAGFIATLAYRHRLPIGMDIRDGEIAAWSTISLAGVGDEFRAAAFERECHAFLARLQVVVRELVRFQRKLAAPETYSQRSVDLSQPIITSA